ncbi:MAG: glycosyltransferase family 2 protein [Chloroflexi bacterium OHK40]
MILLLAALSATLLCAGYAHDWRRLQRRPRLGSGDPDAPDAPLVSILVPARNEERSIARCVSGALGQRYPNFELLVLDDGSTDGTATVLAGFTDSRLRVLRGRPLPPGWVGKCHACQQLADAARGEWLLFLDADTAPEPELLAALLGYARRRELRLATLFPFLELGSLAERAVLPPFLALISALYPFERFEHPDARPEEVLANGQCILVERAAYEAIGGHGAVRAEVLEDVRLAQGLRAAGYRVGGAEGMDLLRVRMYHNGREVAAGLTKNAAAGYRSGGRRSAWVASRQLALAWGPLWLLGAGGALLGAGQQVGWPVLALGLLASGTALAYWGALYRQLYGLSPAHAVLWPFGLLAYLLIALRGMWNVQRGRGVVWKGRTYSG